jgi:hypothetical protein
MPPDSPTACLDRDLLRRAWPDGFLAVPGLATVGGWRCYRADGPEPIAEWIKGGPGGLAPTRFRLYNGRDWCRHDEYQPLWEPEDPRHACDDGDLLPLVDPADVGSFAILLRDLAVALYPDLVTRTITGLALSYEALLGPGGLASLRPGVGQPEPAPPRWGWRLIWHEAAPPGGTDTGGASSGEARVHLTDVPADVRPEARVLVLARIAVRERRGR